MRTFPRLPALFVTFAVSSPALCLSLDQQLAYCSNVDGKFSADIQISGCTAIIDAGTADSRTLARIYFRRALAYDDKSEFALAIRDYNEVIRLNPDDATALNNRALDLAILGRDLEQALIDSNRAVSLEPVADDFSTKQSRTIRKLSRKIQRTRNHYMHGASRKSQKEIRPAGLPMLRPRKPSRPTLQMNSCVTA